MTLMIVGWAGFISAEHNPDFNLAAFYKLKKQVHNLNIFVKIWIGNFCSLDFSKQIQFFLLGFELLDYNIQIFRTDKAAAKKIAVFRPITTRLITIQNIFHPTTCFLFGDGFIISQNSARSNLKNHKIWTLFAQISTCFNLWDIHFCDPEKWIGYYDLFPFGVDQKKRKTGSCLPSSP